MLASDCFFFFFSSRRRHTRFDCDWSSDVCSSDVNAVVFTRIDDHPARLREVLAHEEARSASRQLLDQLAAVLAPLPSELRWVVEEVLRAPAELQTVQQVAARARVDRRTFERC